VSEKSWHIESIHLLDLPGGPILKLRRIEKPGRKGLDLDPVVDQWVDNKMSANN
jgi:hypothetical protein